VNDILAYHRFALERETFLQHYQHYHKRSNVESTFGAIKAKFGSAVCAKSDAGQVNEVLAKVLRHNLCVLIRAMLQLGIEA
jgi:transposase